MGGASAHIEAPMLIFMNANRSYPIIGTPDKLHRAEGVEQQDGIATVVL